MGNDLRSVKLLTVRRFNGLCRNDYFIQFPKLPSNLVPLLFFHSSLILFGSKSISRQIYKVISFSSLNGSRSVFCSSHGLKNKWLKVMFYCRTNPIMTEDFVFVPPTGLKDASLTERSLWFQFEALGSNTEIIYIDK